MHQQDPAGQGMGREAGRVMRGGAGRWEALEDLKWRSQRHTRGVVLRKVRVPGPRRSHQDILVVKTVGPQKVPRKGAGSEWRARGPAWAMLRG